MKLSDLIQECRSMVTPLSAPETDPDILSVCSRAQDITPGGLFFAIPGFSADGHDFIHQAVENGCAAAVVQKEIPGAGPQLTVPNARRAMACMSAAFYGHPSRDMVMIGVTGTNGKTTVTYLLESILKHAGHNPGVIGTVNIRFNGKVFDNPVTTPDAIDLQQALTRMKDAGVTHVIMEVSSHGVDLHRVDGCTFDVGVFTNLSQDHLDYHPDMASYFACKKRFFTEHLAKSGHTAVINTDDPRGVDIASALELNTIDTSTYRKTRVCAHQISDDISGLEGLLLIEGRSFPLCSALTGRFNLENILSAAAAAHAVGVPADQIIQGIELCTIIPGRLEKIDNSLDRYVFVDYAHTPDALESILATLKTRAPGKVITVFGCGGDRDRKKRPLMGEAAQKYSDIILVTSDNPRTENPDRIITDILGGVSCTPYGNRTYTNVPQNDSTCRFIVEPDRKTALETAVLISSPRDIIIAAGKGHETYQITNTGTIHFDDKEVLEQALENFKNAPAPKPIAFSTRDLKLALEMDPILDSLTGQVSFDTIHTDSRTIETGALFLALKGPNFDGSSFILPLLEQGIQGFIAPEGFVAALNPEEQERLTAQELILFETGDTLLALQRLARFQRNRAGVKVVGITGSNGKTTTRKLARDIFANQGLVLATQGNLNNEIGVPLTLLGLSWQHEFAIIEMGMNHPGEMRRLSRTAQPDIAVITNISPTHLEGLGTIENVARAKAEIFEHMPPGAIAIINRDDDFCSLLTQLAGNTPAIRAVLTFGTSEDADIIASEIKNVSTGLGFNLSAAPASAQATSPTQMVLNTPARFMITNALAAASLAIAAGLSMESIKKGLAAFLPVKGRMDIQRLSADITLIDDTYNASPASMIQALNTLRALSGQSDCIIALGDMLELGQNASDLHEQVGAVAADTRPSRLYLFGNHAPDVRNGAVSAGLAPEAIFVGSKKDIANDLIQRVNTHHPKVWILVKGSRGMAMEEVIQALKHHIKEITA
ncbi:MAG: UDP-N-acetylmuramoyl-L-alanyl-D-glutamate--2,6-diaminopimelate ligase [Desulfobacteraceae bacterium]|nr:MAG: UDP-N-acetylmuramoyl-L-alanyl-D-glutamate--2,6-diaminopimelate ligase [Desulfobacteraceae bacterium]